MNASHSDPTDELLMIIGIFTHFFALETTLAERQFFRALAMLIGRRAARMSSCGIAAIVSKMGYLDEGCVVGADGSLYNVRLLRTFLSHADGGFLNRNTRALQTECMKVLKIFSELKGGTFVLCMLKMEAVLVALSSPVGSLTSSL
jgi:hexokinase